MMGYPEGTIDAGLLAHRLLSGEASPGDAHAAFAALERGAPLVRHGGSVTHERLRGAWGEVFLDEFGRWWLRGRQVAPTTIVERHVVLAGYVCTRTLELRDAYQRELDEHLHDDTAHERHLREVVDDLSRQAHELQAARQLD